MTLDRLFILKSDRQNYSNLANNLYCWTSELLEILLRTFPDLNQKIDVERVCTQESIESVADLVGEFNPSLPILVFADNAPRGMEAEDYQGIRFVKGNKIMAALRKRHGIPVFPSSDI